MQQMQSSRAQVSATDCSLSWRSVTAQDEPTLEAHSGNQEHASAHLAAGARQGHAAHECSLHKC